jgi:hypothetical protein
MRQVNLKKLEGYDALKLVITKMFYPPNSYKLYYVENFDEFIKYHEEIRALGEAGEILEVLSLDSIGEHVYFVKDRGEIVA